MKIFKYAIILLVLLAPINQAKANSTFSSPVIMGPVTVTNITFSTIPLVGGTVVSLTGSGFNTMTRPYLVPANGTTASSYILTVLSQSDSQYSFAIPQGITAGTYTFQFITDGNYGRIFLANSYNYQEYYFTIGMGTNSSQPSVSNVSPSSATIGSNVTITGSNFADQVSLYFFGSSLAQPLVLTANSSNNGTKIVFTVPDSLNAGTYYVSVAQPSGESNQTYFNVSTVAPYVTSISPASGPAGTVVTITGGNFSGTNTVSYNSSFDAAGSENYIPSSNGGTTLQFITPTTWLTGIHNLAVGNLNGWSDYKTFNVASTQVNEKHPEGTNVVVADGTVYRIMGNGRNPYTSAGAFTSYKFNTFATVVPANSFDLALPIGTYTPTGSTTSVPYYIPPRNGSLINDKGTIYLITGGLRAGFATEAAFKGMGYTYENVYPGDTSFMFSLTPINSVAQRHPNGTLINDNGTLYLMQNGHRVGFPSMDVLESWGYWPEDAVPVNNYDRQTEISGVMQTRMANQLNI